MKSVKILMLLFFSTLFLSCEDEVEILTIERSGYMNFYVNGERWIASGFKLNTGPLVAVVIDSTNFGRPYRRYSLMGFGTEPSGRQFQLSWSFDLSDEENFVGVYNRTYSIEKGGLQGVTLNLETGRGTNLYANYLMSPAPVTTEMRIDRQSTDERLVLGTFKGVLRRDGDSTQVLNIETGIFEDISY